MKRAFNVRHNGTITTIYGYSSGYPVCWPVWLWIFPYFSQWEVVWLAQIPVKFW
jgi:hypothetical protein